MSQVRDNIYLRVDDIMSRVRDNIYLRLEDNLSARPMYVPDNCRNPNFERVRTCDFLCTVDLDWICQSFSISNCRELQP